MTNEKERISGPELEAMAKKIVPKEMLKQSLKDPTMRDFIRIVILFCLTAHKVPDEKQFFSHVLSMRMGKEKRVVNVQFDIEVSGEVVNEQ